MDPSTRLDSEALDLRVFAVEAARLCGASTVGDLAHVTEAALRERGARDVDVHALRALIVAAGGHLAGVRRGRPPSRREDLVRVESWMTPEQIARLDEQRGEMSRAGFVAQLFGR
jgi:hypothetical protein